MNVKNELYKYLNKQSEPVSFSDICESEKFSEIDPKDISFNLRELGSENKAFRSLKDGRAYYSANSFCGEAVNPTKAWIAGVAMKLGGNVVRNGSATDITLSQEQNADEQKISNLLDELDKLTNQAYDIMDQEKKENPDLYKNIDELTYTKGNVFKGNGFTFKIPDGFILKTDVDDEFGTKRDFIAYLPSDDEDNMDNACIKIYGSDTFPSLLGTDQVLLRNAEEASAIYIYEQSSAFKEALSMYDTIFESHTANSRCLISAKEDRSSSFFYSNIPAYDKSKMIRIDVNNIYTSSMEKSRELAETILSNVTSEFRLSPLKSLNDDYFKSDFSSKKQKEWLELLDEWKKSIFITYNSLTQNNQNILLIKVGYGELEADKDTLLIEFKKALEENYYKENIAFDKLNETIISFINSNVINDEKIFNKFNKALTDYINEIDVLSTALTEDEEVSVKSNTTKEIKNALKTLKSNLKKQNVEKIKLEKKEETVAVEDSEKHEEPVDKQNDVSATMVESQKESEVAVEELSYWDKNPERKEKLNNYQYNCLLIKEYSESRSERNLLAGYRYIDEIEKKKSDNHKLAFNLSSKKNEKKFYLIKERNYESLLKDSKTSLESIITDLKAIANKYNEILNKISDVFDNPENEIDFVDNALIKLADVYASTDDIAKLRQAAEIYRIFGSSENALIADNKAFEIETKVEDRILKETRDFNLVLRKKKKKSKTVLILILLLSLIAGGVYFYTNNFRSEYVPNSKDISMVSEYSSKDMSYSIDFYSRNGNDLNYAEINAEIQSYYIDISQLKLACNASMLIDGLNLEYVDYGKTISIKAGIEKDKISSKIIDFASQFNILSKDEEELLRSALDGDLNDLYKALVKNNYNVKKVK